MNEKALALLDRRLRLHPGCRYDPDGPALWVRRKNPVERFLALVAHRGRSQVRLTLDAKSDRVVGVLVADGPLTGRALAERLGVAADEEAVVRSDPELVALVVFLWTLRRGGVLVTEPISST